MSNSFRPTLETLERREVFSTTVGICLSAEAPLSVPAHVELASSQFRNITLQVAGGDVNGDDSLARSQPIAGDGFGLNVFHLLPYIEQDNLYKFQGGCNAGGDAFLDAVYRDIDRRGLTALLLPYIEQENLYKQLQSAVDPKAVDSAFSAADAPWGELDRQQIIAILIGLMNSGDEGGKTQRLTDVTDGTSNTLAVTHDADFEKWASAFDSATPERQSQIIAILIGLLREPTKTPA